MSEQQDQHQDIVPDKGVEREANGETGRETNLESEAAERPHQARTSKWPARLALLLALVAIGLWLWQWMQPDQAPDADWALASEQERLADRLDSRLEALAADVSALRDELSEREQSGALSEALEQTEAGVRELESGLAGLERDLERQNRQVVARLEALEDREGEQRQVDRELDRRLLMLEAAALLRFGQERAELAADPGLAAEAYRRAGDLLRQADDPRLGQVRRELARELEALEALEQTDWLQIQSRLERLSAQAPAWPIRRPDSAAEADAGDDISAEQAGWRQSLRDTFSELVRVRPRNAVLLDDEEIEALRQQIVLRLTAAELAAVRRDAAELGHHVEAAVRLLETHFDGADTGVSEALGLLRTVAVSETETEALVLGAALAGLREQLDR